MSIRKAHRPLWQWLPLLAAWLLPAYAAAAEQEGHVYFSLNVGEIRMAEDKDGNDLGKGGALGLRIGGRAAEMGWFLLLLEADLIQVFGGGKSADEDSPIEWDYNSFAFATALQSRGDMYLRLRAGGMFNQRILDDEAHNDFQPFAGFFLGKKITNDIALELGFDQVPAGNRIDSDLQWLQFGLRVGSP